MQTNHKSVILGGGCFWCVEAVFKRVNGVTKVISGYAGGFMQNPSYEEVCAGLTGHAEVVNVIYDPDVVSLTELLAIFFSIHDPTSIDQQDGDIGPQYRSIIVVDKNEKNQVDEYIAVLEKSKSFSKPIVTKVHESLPFYAAEDYHQDYYEKNSRSSYCRLVIKPKIEKIKALFKKDVKTSSFV